MAGTVLLGVPVMTLARQLDALRASEQACRLAAFGDLGACIVLRNSCAAEHPQEYFDELCQQARRGFTLLDAGSAGAPGAPADDVLVLTPGEARVFVRAADGSGDAVLCVCSSAEAAGRLVAPARNLLAAMAEGA
ncbi:MAG: hypothetical protein AB3N24_02895 [Leisingera sp.]